MKEKAKEKTEEKAKEQASPKPTPRAFQGLEFTLLILALFGVLSISLKGVAPLRAPDHVARAVLMESSGKVIAAGRYYDGKTLQFELRRFERDGSPDLGFGKKGNVIFNIGVKDDIVQALATQADGKIWIAGRSHNGKKFDFVVARLKPDGSKDSSFGKDGMVITHLSKGNDVARAITIQPDGKALVVGYAQKENHYQFAAVRYLSDGMLDNSFGEGGKLLIELSPSDSGAVSVNVLKDGKILIGGCFFNGQSWDLAILRLLSDGKYDTSFGKEGKVIYPMSGTNDQVHLAIQNDGKIIAAGNTLLQDRFAFALLRFDEKGSLDKSFGIDGKSIIQSGTGDSQPYSVAIQKDGKIVAVGSSFVGNNRRFTIGRFLPDGTVDPSFGTGGFMTPLLGSEHAVAKSVTVDGDGNIVAAGCAYHKKSFDFALARVNAQGTLEWHFPTAARNLASMPPQ